MLTFEQMMTEKLGFFTSTENVIFTSINDIFGPSGTLPILTEDLTAYLTYYIIIEIAHLCVDVLLFIPRIAHSWMDAYTRKNSQ